ncbi:hypothetical protein [Eremococcus coleocola]|uniref:Uncharacterized protein n=1 Tax=Eremococcus coleocola ACS-139-V-Col8 TaxID=908337 RepID=E4KMA7_9LACT|nr:hypothetical protein [Eremococcus coleocola]EFR31919.1 hypothetical protein HMPREF9257_1793 [Eremococcus coleocola ACS-139-V-Col8]
MTGTGFRLLGKLQTVLATARLSAKVPSLACGPEILIPVTDISDRDLALIEN